MQQYVICNVLKECCIPKEEVMNARRWHINDQILHYEPTSWPSKQVFDELLFVCANFDYLPLIKNTCDISGADLFKFP
jgi:hypothetical protein